MSTELKPIELLKAELPQLEAVLRLNAADGVDVKTLALQELEHIRMHCISKPEILDCLPATIVMAVKTVLKQNLSLDPNAGLVYVKTRNVKVKDNNGQMVTKKALEIMPSANGIISINRQCGRILDMKNPVVTKDATGKVIAVSVEILLPSTPEPRWEKREFDESDFYRWRRASHKENGRYKDDFGTAAATESLKYANENYTNWKGGIDPEFARAKAVRHGLKKLGTNPNEGKFKSIIAHPIEVIVDAEKDNAAGSEEANYAEVVESTTNEAIKPNTEFATTNDL
jgi:hypothetical protein